LSSPAYRHSLNQCDVFTGLEADTNRYELLLLVKRIGKTAGFTPRMIELLDYYIAYTRDQDWEQGNRPIVYQSLSRTALSMGVSERQIQKLERRLFEIGAITWSSSGNHKRYGSRDPETGRILFAYGVDLTPLAYLRSKLEGQLQEKQLYDQAWITTRREISSCRGLIRSLILEIQEQGIDQRTTQSLENDYQAIAYQLRTHIDLADMRSLLDRHKTLYSRLLDFVAVDTLEPEQHTKQSNLAKETSERTVRSEPKVRPLQLLQSSKKIITGSPPDLARQKSVVEPAKLNRKEQREPSPITPKQILLASSDRFRSHLPLEPRPLNWSDIHEAAYRLRAELFISQRSWQEACQVLGRTEAALCVLVTDQGQDRPENPVVRPAAYFGGMIKKARAGELNLQKSVFGLLEAHS